MTTETLERLAEGLPSPREISEWTVANYPALISALKENKRMRGVIERLGSSEAFDVARDLGPDDKELVARMDYARAALQPQGEK